MGEYADDALFAGLDQSWGYRPRHRVRRQPLKICNTCGKRSLIWKNENDEWFLAELDLISGEFVKHSCKMKDAFKK